MEKRTPDPHTKRQTDSARDSYYSVDVRYKSQKVESFRFTKRVVSVGRHPTDDIRLLQDPYISRKHFRIELYSSYIRIVDQDSKHGVYYQGERIWKVKLSGPGVFQINDYELTITPTFQDNLEETQAAFDEKTEFTKTAQGLAQFQEDAEEAPEPVSKARAKKEEFSFSKKFFEERPKLLKGVPIRLEAHLIWKEQLLQTKELAPGEKVILGSDQDTAFFVPGLKADAVIAGYVTGDSAKLLIPQGGGL